MRTTLYKKATAEVLKNGGYISTSPLSGSGTAFDANSKPLGKVDWRTTNALIDSMGLKSKNNAGGFGWDHYYLPVAEAK